MSTLKSEDAAWTSRFSGRLRQREDEMATFESVLFNNTSILELKAAKLRRKSLRQFHSQWNWYEKLEPIEVVRGLKVERFRIP